MVSEKTSLSRLKSSVQLYPQIVGAISVSVKKPLEEIHEIQTLLSELRSEMGNAGRVLLRYSGTENKIRLLIEGANAGAVDQWYQRLEKCVRICLA